jgi:hypothetical protein
MIEPGRSFLDNRKYDRMMTSAISLLGCEVSDVTAEFLLLPFARYAAVLVAIMQRPSNDLLDSTGHV